ncbi:magnesium transporter CorA family protein [Rhodobacter calidifons]|uniref:Magnesium transporter CorA family protein n=1 Tax=Rhodobacter calidifons TaxID=2715277 RepID=A0ABX0G4G8_9RHOB|nr:magnesium transporter CorA family protein [Rhodobacter calidifons]
MITAFVSQGQRLARLDHTFQHLRDAVWIDLEAPTVAEEDAVEAALGIDIPTREDMQEIEVSSRIYREDGALFLTAQVVATNEDREIEIGPVTFVVLPDRLVSVHYHHPGSFEFFAEWASRHDTPISCGVDALLGLLEAVVDRLADILEAEARRHDSLSKALFARDRTKGSSEDLSDVLNRIGQAEDVNAKVNESLGTLVRLAGYLTVDKENHASLRMSQATRTQAKTLLQDIRSLREVTAAQADKVRFLLDATLGVINIRQSDVIKIFSVVAFVFLPPTLIASIYGMNFEHMPELSWTWGYPMALGMMVVSAVVPWLFFRWKKWL